jgi:hypothetical protein
MSWLQRYQQWMAAGMPGAPAPQASTDGILSIVSHCHALPKARGAGGYGETAVQDEGGWGPPWVPPEPSLEEAAWGGGKAGGNKYIKEQNKNHNNINILVLQLRFLSASSVMSFGGLSLMLASPS